MSSDDDKEEFGLSLSHKIMLAAIFSLIAVVVLVILLNFYRMYRLRHQILVSPNRLETEVSRIQVISTHPEPKPGIDRSVIESTIPMIIYKRDGGESVECSVCLSNIVEGGAVRVLPNCKHVFHMECIDLWLVSQSSCPVCRTEVEPRLVAEESECESGTGFEPTAPPVEMSVQNGSGRLESKGSSSQMSSFRRMLSRGRSSMKIGSCGDLVLPEDLERPPST